MSLTKWARGLVRSTLPEPKKPSQTDFQAALQADNFEKAISILKEECNRGNADAMTVLASMYSTGRAVEQTDEDAILWYRQGAVRGNAEAQALLGSFLASGRGCEPNLSEATFWLYKAAKAGCQEALDWLADLVLQEPDAVGPHFSWNDLTSLLKARGIDMMRKHVRTSP